METIKNRVILRSVRIKRGFPVTQNSYKKPSDNAGVKNSQLSGNNNKKTKCRLCGDRDETINHKITACSTLAKRENKTRHDLEGNVFLGELCKK